MSEKTICDMCDKPIGMPKVKLKVKWEGRRFLAACHYGSEMDFCNLTCAINWLCKERDKL